MQITVEVPEAYLVEDSPAELGRRLKLYAALLMFQAGEISSGGATELADVDRFTFAAECNRHGIPLVDYASGELRDEFESFQRAS